MKKLSKLLFGCILMFLFCYNVFAEMIAIDDVAEEFGKTYTISSLNQLGSTLSAEVDIKNYKFNFMGDGEVVDAFDYTDEYIEYNNRDAVVTENNYDDDWETIFYIEGIVEALFNLTGNKDMMLNEEMDIANISYEEYGFQMETEPYEYSGTDEDGGKWSASGEYLKYFKISLDSELISKLAEDYGVAINTEEESLFKDATPIMKIGDEVTSSTVWLSASVEGYEDEKELETPLCSFYRSTSLDGEYELVTEWQTECLGGGYIKDEGLQSGTTYYYKAKVVGGTNYSEVVSVTTLSDNGGSDDEITDGSESNESNQNVSESNNNAENITNPKTGNVLIYLVIGLLIISVISFVMMFRYLKKQNM